MPSLVQLYLRRMLIRYHALVQEARVAIVTEEITKKEGDLKRIRELPKTGTSSPSVVAAQLSVLTRIR